MGASGGHTNKFYYSISTVKPCYKEHQGTAQKVRNFEKFVLTKFVISRVLPIRKTFAENRGSLIGSLKREVRYNEV